MDPDTINLPTKEDLANGIYPSDEGHPFEEYDENIDYNDLNFDFERDNELQFEVDQGEDEEE